MTDEQIKQNALDYRNRTKEFGETIVEATGRQIAYEAGAHSRDEEIRELLEKFTYEIDSLIAQKEDLQEELDQLRNPWISVEDRLPNLEDVVFFRLPKGRPYVGSYFTKDKLFMSIEGCYFVEGVTHWMQIPELKKGK